MGDFVGAGFDVYLGSRGVAVLGGLRLQLGVRLDVSLCRGIWEQDGGKVSRGT